MMGITQTTTDKLIVHVFHGQPTKPCPFAWVAVVTVDTIDDVLLATATDPTGQRWWLRSNVIGIPTGSTSQGDLYLTSSGQWYKVGDLGQPELITAPQLPFINDATYQQAIETMTAYQSGQIADPQHERYPLADNLHQYTSVFGWQL